MVCGRCGVVYCCDVVCGVVYRSLVCVMSCVCRRVCRGGVVICCLVSNLFGGAVGAMDSVSDFESGGCGFESRIAYSLPLSAFFLRHKSHTLHTPTAKKHTPPHCMLVHAAHLQHHGQSAPALALIAIAPYTLSRWQAATRADLYSVGILLLHDVLVWIDKRHYGGCTTVHNT